MRALVVVPTYDEVDSLATVVERLGACDADADVLVVDDASPDGTGQLADRLAVDHARLQVLHRAGKGGLGGAYRAGFAWGMQRGFDAFVEMDADLSHDPADVGRLLRTLAGADVVIGSRYVPGGRVLDWPPRRLALSRGGNRYVRLVTGLPVADATAGFRAYRRAVLEEVGLGTVSSDGYGFQVEMALRAWQTGFRVVEVPITFTERRDGASKMSRAIVAEAVLSVARWGLAGPRRAGAPHPRSVATSRAPSPQPAKA